MVFMCTSLDLGDRILALLRERGGSLFQSEIVEFLALPKSTVSEAINRLHGMGWIEKVRKGAGEPHPARTG